MFSSEGILGWIEESDTLQPEHYSKSQTVRDWLVYTALAGNHVPLTADLRILQKRSFERACHDLRRGLITLDYQVPDEDMVAIPPVRHPHYMQAMLYWCVRMDCTVAELFEAHARLGSAAPFEHLRQEARRVRREEARTRTVSKWWLFTQSQAKDAVTTMPVSFKD